jgi:hypothetical protein
VHHYSGTISQTIPVFENQNSFRLEPFNRRRSYEVSCELQYSREQHWNISTTVSRVFFCEPSTEIHKVVDPELENQLREHQNSTKETSYLLEKIEDLNGITKKKKRSIVKFQNNKRRLPC